jgi:hypothetical protein
MPDEKYEFVERRRFSNRLGEVMVLHRLDTILDRSTHCFRATWAVYIEAGWEFVLLLGMWLDVLMITEEGLDDKLC